MKKLKRISLEYEDGTNKNISADSLETKVFAALADSGLCEARSEISSAKHYLLLVWKDGWKEVLAINSDSADLIRYYVIRRIEDRGRLALDVGEAYPKLHVIERLPGELSRLFIVSENSTKSYGLSSELESYEGVFESGGKKEYKKYDRGNAHFKNEFTENHKTPMEIDNAVREALQENELDPHELLAEDSHKRIQSYQNIACAVGIKGVKRESDVYGMLELIIKNLLNVEPRK